jgi:hypothetical protein
MEKSKEQLHAELQQLREANDSLAAELAVLKKQPNVDHWRRWVNEKDVETAKTFVRVDLLLSQLADEIFADGAKLDVSLAHPRIGAVKGAANARAARLQVRRFVADLERWEKIARESLARDAKARGIKDPVIKPAQLDAFPREQVPEEGPSLDQVILQDAMKHPPLLQELIEKIEQLLSWYSPATFDAEGKPAADLRSLRQTVAQARARLL